jgi:hypothetical protein
MAIFLPVCNVSLAPAESVAFPIRLRMIPSDHVPIIGIDYEPFMNATLKQAKFERAKGRSMQETAFLQRCYFIGMSVGPDVYFDSGCPLSCSPQTARPPYSG